jgi:hypothetical protein
MKPWKSALLRTGHDLINDTVWLLGFLKIKICPNSVRFVVRPGLQQVHDRIIRRVVLLEFNPLSTVLSASIL